MNERAPSETYQSESEDEKQQLLDTLKTERERLERRKKEDTVESDIYHRERIFLENGIRIIEQQGAEAFYKWIEEEGKRNEHLKAGTYALAEYAMNNQWTNFEYIREHYLANAQGRMRKQQFPKHSVNDLNKKINKRRKDE